MTDSANDLPDDIERLKAMLIAERATHAAERARLVEQNDRLLHTLRQLQRNQFGRKSERLSEDQLNLGLEDLETAIASGEAAQEADATLAASRTRQRRVNRGHLPAHLPHEVCLPAQVVTADVFPVPCRMRGIDRLAIELC